MSRTLTNNLSLAYAIEESLGVLPGSPTWHQIEPNTIDSFGADITTVMRDPISKNRQRRKSIVTDLDSTAGFAADLTMNHFLDFIEGFCFATAAGTAFRPTAVTSTGYTVASGGALVADTLVYARGFTTTANNGLKVVGAASTGTEVKTSGLTIEASPPSKAELEVAGVRGAAGDLEINAGGNLISTTLDFTTLGLTVGQVIWVGGLVAANQFALAANTGFARITAIAANILTLDKKSTTFVTDDGTSTGSGGTARAIDILFGRFVRNVAVDDSDFLERSFQFEAAYQDLGGVGTDEYEYAKGNYCNEVSFELPLTNKATVKFGFIGTDTEPPSTTRATNAATPVSPSRTEAFNTSADIVRLRVTEYDQTGLTTDFKSMTLKLMNNVSPEKVLGTLGARFMNYGDFGVEVETKLLFTNSDVAAAVRDNTVLSMDFALKNTDGGIFVDLPAITLGDGKREFPVNESILIDVKTMAFEDPTLGTSIGVSIFPYLP